MINAFFVFFQKNSCPVIFASCIKRSFQYIQIFFVNDQSFLNFFSKNLVCASLHRMICPNLIFIIFWQTLSDFPTFFRKKTKLFFLSPRFGSPRRRNPLSRILTSFRQILSKNPTFFRKKHGFRRNGSISQGGYCFETDYCSILHVPVVVSPTISPSYTAFAAIYLQKQRHSSVESLPKNSGDAFPLYRGYRHPGDQIGP